MDGEEGERDAAPAGLERRDWSSAPVLLAAAIYSCVDVSYKVICVGASWDVLGRTFGIVF